jgi:hypothetical protein
LLPFPQLLGLIGLLGGGAVSVVGIINLKKDGMAVFFFFFCESKAYCCSEGSKTATIIQIVVYITLTILSIFGYILFQDQF